MDVSAAERSAEEQRTAYAQGEWGNPLTTTPLGGRILSGLQLPWFTLLPPRGFGVLTTIGRRTGMKRRKCVRAIRDGNRVYLVSLRGAYGHWLRNLRAHPHVTLRIRGGTFEGLARVIADSAEVGHARSVYCGTVTPFDRLEYIVHRAGWPTRDRIRDLHEHWIETGLPVVIELATSP